MKNKDLSENISKTILTSETEMTFGGLGIAPKILDILLKLGFKIPTSIQHKAIPVANEGKDVIGIAQTGTGKTLAFSIPLIQQILKLGKGKGLIVLPTRELALQVNESIQKIGRNFGIKSAVLIGGYPIYQQIKNIRNNPHIIIGTPGRIIDHIEKRTLNLSDVSILVLDEADRMFDMGFAPQINKILQVIPKDRQTMLFSATMPDGIVKIASNHMKLPVRVEIALAGTTAENIEHELFVVKKDQKLPLLRKLLEEYKGSVLVFVRIKFGAKKICDSLRRVGISAVEIHSNRSLSQRREALEGFKCGRYRVLVATDIASRGIDVKGIEVVINFDLPENPEDYVHRIGRTGRAGMAGRAISFVLSDQGSKVREIEKLTRLYLPISKLPDLSFELNRQMNTFYKKRPSNKFNYGRRK
ncbi:MAG: ATP-dependent helicase [Candidatus Magasanikbacteria bacterium CG10_big_fil_rev_8_21_14_0_10_36_32]|uniref:ATP-dependent helicase n=1 Tax=Candidatus Magasanikbacteria bacterium CG10_big_fil_rev_8_21_14_0_10_36_32 TaxID=1974646 RepID=A0A2M6W6W7_9BACT|nr:MAG: ATP-dependent helicase [Candidatus Magasanikbacteria bacterium CG10_big_fil_rev_8_21_14_0_10_36_32]